MMQKNNIERMFSLYEVLMNDTDEGHQMTLKQIMDVLADSDVKMDGKTFYSYVSLLREHNVDVVKERNVHHTYYIGERIFDFVEIKLMIDAIYSSSVLDEEKCRSLRNKLLRFVSKYQASDIKKEQLPIMKGKEFNRYFYSNVDEIYRAMLENHQIEFNYFSYELDKRNQLKKVHRRQGKKYVVSPYAFCWNQDNYYVLVSDDQHENIASYRVDRLDCVKTIENSKRKPLGDCDLKGQRDLKSYVLSMFSMYGSDGGKTVDVRLKFADHLLDSVIDRFANSRFYRNEADYWIECRVNVAISPTFFSWIFQFGKEMKIVGPVDVQKQYVEFLKENIDIYA